LGKKIWSNRDGLSHLDSSRSEFDQKFSKLDCSFSLNLGEFSIGNLITKEISYEARWLVNYLRHALNLLDGVPIIELPDLFSVILEWYVANIISLLFAQLFKRVLDSGSSDNLVLKVLLILKIERICPWLGQSPLVHDWLGVITYLLGQLKCFLDTLSCVLQVSEKVIWLLWRVQDFSFYVDYLVLSWSIHSSGCSRRIVLDSKSILWNASVICSKIYRTFIHWLRIGAWCHNFWSLAESTCQHWNICFSRGYFVDRSKIFSREGLEICSIWN